MMVTSPRVPSRAEATSNEGGDSIASLLITAFKSLGGNMQALARNRTQALEGRREGGGVITFFGELRAPFYD